MRSGSRGRRHRGDGQSSPVGAEEGRVGRRRRAPRHECLLPATARLADCAVPGDRSDLLLMRPAPLLLRQALAEFLGSAGLVAVVIGSGIAAQRLSPHDTGLELLENAVVTGAGLAALILAFGPASGAHFNPVVSLVDRAFGGLTSRQLLTYLPAQLAGGVLGAVLANLMFGLDAINVSDHHRSSGGLWLSEALATFGLIVLIFGLVRSGKAALAPFAVGAYIAAAYWWSSSTSFANPMIDVARTLSNTFAGIAPSSVPMFVVMQLIGAAVAVVTVAVLYPDVAVVADDVVVPHETPTVVNAGG